jgi:VIT1/CCC1 family predicted Fe2+/Mn2+ transporter
MDLSNIDPLIAQALKGHVIDEPSEARKAIDNAEWIKKIIVSCQNSFQLEVAKVMLEMFGAKYGTKGKLYDDLFTAYLAKDAMILIP